MTATASRRTHQESPAGSPVTTYYLLAVASAMLVVVGLAVVLSSTANISLQRPAGNPFTLFLIQAAALAIGMGALVVGSRMPVTFWKRMAVPILVAALLLLMVVVFVGEASGGNKNWIRFGSVTFQPSEVAKLGLALFLGVALSVSRHLLTSLRGLIAPAGLAVVLVLALVLWGRDMGTALVIMLMVAAAYWVAGLPLRYFAMGAVAAAIGIVVLLNDADSRGSRIDAWLNPEAADPSGLGLQALHSKWALASGGLWGLGPGMSREKWGYLPVADSDFIFAIIGEEYGLIGTVLMLIAFGMIAVAVNRLVHRHKDPFVQIAAAAIGAWIVGQACVNIAVVTGLAPITGVPLPLVSSGGSSLIVSLAAIGVLMAFARREPGAPEAFAARPSVVKKSFAVIARGRRG